MMEKGSGGGDDDDDEHNHHPHPMRHRHSSSHSNNENDNGDHHFDNNNNHIRTPLSVVRTSPPITNDDEPDGLMRISSPTTTSTVSKEQDITSSNKSFLFTPVIWCILITETAERFAYFGFRVILVLYFTLELKFDDNTAIALFAYNSSLAYFAPIVGAAFADGILGRYRTIVWFGWMYVLGLSILTYAAGIDTDNNDDDSLTWKRISTFFGLFLVCLGTGGIKPCVSAFGADQVSLIATKRHQRQPERRTNNNHNQTKNGLREEDPSSGQKEEDSHPITTILSDDNDQCASPTSRHHSTIPLVVDPRETTIILDDENEQRQGDGDDNKSEQVRAFFNYFYFCINVGAVTSIALVPLVRGHLGGFQPAFALPLAFMVFAMLLFLSKRREYVHHHHAMNSNNSILTTFRITIWLVQQTLYYSNPAFAQQYCPSWLRPGPGPLRERLSMTADDEGDNNHPTTHEQHQQRRVDNYDDGIAAIVDGVSNDETQNVVCEQQQQHDERQRRDDNHHDDIRQQMEDAAQALHALPVLAMFPIFWALYDQQGSVWTLQAIRMRFPRGMQPEQMNIVNPLEIMIFIPLFDRIIYPRLERRHIDISPLRRMSWGMVLAAISFFLSGIVESTIEYRDNNDLPKVHVLWQLLQITTLAIAEIFVSVTGLEFAYSTSPDRLKAFVTALFLSTTGIGDCFSGILYSTIFAQMDRAVVMHICAFLMLANQRLFLCVARWYERHRFDDPSTRGSSVELSTTGQMGQIVRKHDVII